MAEYIARPPTVSGKPAFGRALAGEYANCAGGCKADYAGYRFRIGPEDMRELAARARLADPRFAPDPGAYVVESYECRAETYLDAELGLTFQNCMLGLTAG